MDVGGRLANVFQGSDVSGHSSIDGVPITLIQIENKHVKIGISNMQLEFGGVVDIRRSYSKILESWSASDWPLKSGLRRNSSAKMHPHDQMSTGVA